MPHITRFPALAIAALAFAAAGCGDDDETTTDAGASGATGASGVPLSHAEFVDAADAICKEGGDEIDQAGRELGGQPSQADVESFVTDTLVPGIQTQIDQVAALTPPEGEEDQVQEFIDSAQSELDGLADDPSSLQGNPFTETAPLAQDLGLKECAS